MRKFFTLLLLAAAFSVNAQNVLETFWQGGFEQPGFGPVSTNVNGTASFANAGITADDAFWLNVWSIDSKNTSVTIVDDASEGSQAFLFTIGESTGDIRMRTSSNATDYVNGEFVKVTLDAKTDQAGVDAGGKLISVVKNTFKDALTTSYASYELYGAIANNRIQIWFPNTGAGEGYNVWVDNVKVEKVDAIPVDPVDPEFTAFPYTEDFESGDYTIGADIAKKNDTDGENDFWNGGTHPLFDRYWRGNFTTEYLTSVDADAYAGAKAMKLAVNTMEGSNFRLRSVNIPAGDYTITFKAKTDGAGVGKAKIGFVEDAASWYSLTDTYAEYSGSYTVTVNPNNGTTRLIVFYTCDPNVAGTQSYNIWIDDIEVKEGLPTSIDQPLKAEMRFYPNPVQSELNIKTDAKLSKVEVYSLTGQKVLGDYTGSKLINVASLSKGVYIVSVEADGQIIRKKVTKQ